jgi:hypothetical protein
MYLHDVTCILVIKMSWFAKDDAEEKSKRIRLIDIVDFGNTQFSIYHDDVNCVTIYTYWRYGEVSMSVIPDWKLTPPDKS